MEDINVFELSMVEIDYRMLRLKEKHREILLLMLKGKSNSDIASMYRIGTGGFYAWVTEACRCAGVDNKAQLIGMFAIWEYSQKKKQY